MKKYFTYSDEYISGWTFFGRTFLNYILIIFLGLGLYLQSINTYKRAKSLGHNNSLIFWGIFGFIELPLALLLLNVYFFDHQPLIHNIPIWYLFFVNGNKKKRIEEQANNGHQNNKKQISDLWGIPPKKEEAAEQTKKAAAAAEQTKKNKKISRKDFLGFK